MIYDSFDSTERCVEAQDKSRVSGHQDPLNNKLEQELIKESQLIKKDKLQEVHLHNVD